MSIFGKVILDELTRRNPDALAYSPPSVHLPTKTRRHLIPVVMLVGLLSATFFYDWVSRKLRTRG